MSVGMQLGQKSVAFGGKPVAIDGIEVSHYKIPTDSHESDGTLEWDHTNICIVFVHGGGHTGLGYTYAGSAVAALIHNLLSEAVHGQNAMAPTELYMKMWRRARNLGRPGVVSMAISAVDCAIWDLKARLVGLPLATLLGPVRESAAVYGSGGFTSYSNKQIAKQLGGWARQGICAVKMKIGREPHRDPERVRAAREAIGDDTKLYVDSNGAYSPRQALAQMQMLERYDVRWFEEPVTSDNHRGLAFVREHAGPKIDIAAGEYGYDPFYFRRLLEDQCVDVLQADITRCGGVTAFMQVAGLCQAFNIPLSAHTAPALHAHPCCAAFQLTEIEYFHDHARIESILFDGLPPLVDGRLRPDWSRPGNGLEFRRADAQKLAA